MCTGNICRSPAAERLLAHALDDSARVTSAGTFAMVGEGISDPMIRCLERDGIDGGGHIASQFAGADARADLVVCMTGRHREWVIAHAGANPGRTFLLSELAATARAGAPLAGGAAGIADAADEFRGSLTKGDRWDVPDPYMRGQAAYDAAYAMIRECVDEIARWVAIGG